VWVQRMRDDIGAASHHGIEALQEQWVRNPAARLIDFWGGILTSSGVAERSALLRGVEGNLPKYWNFTVKAFYAVKLGIV
jgi:hypothetical protein